jgi:hypothetical protein
MKACRGEEPSLSSGSVVKAQGSGATCCDVGHAGLVFWTDRESKRVVRSFRMS